MSDDTWVAPGAEAAPASAPVPSLGAPIERPLPPPTVAGTTPTGWTPPPKPGLIPLRPLTLGAILSGSFAVLRRNPRATLAPALVIYLLVGLITAGATAAVTTLLFSLSESSGDVSGVGPVLGIGVIAILVAGIVSLVGSSVLQGIVAAEVARASVAERLTFRGLWRRVKGRLGALIGWALLALVVIVAGLTLVILMIVAASTASPGTGIGAGLLIVPGAVVVWAWLTTKFSIVPSALVIERARFGSAIGRSWRLTRRNFWRVFGIRLLVAVMIYFATQIVSIPVSLLASLLTPLVAINDDPDAIQWVALATSGVTLLVVAVIAAIGAVLTTATDALLYIDLRMRHEGLDLTLQRYVEQRAAGAPPSDPYPVAQG